MWYAKNRKLLLMQRVIVTGSTGLIGKEVSNFLEQTDYKVINR